MDPVAFDTLARAIAQPGTRRRLLGRLLVGVPLLGALAPGGEEAAAAERPLERLQGRTPQRNRQQRNNRRRNTNNNKKNNNGGGGQNSGNRLQNPNKCRSSADCGGRACCSGTCCQPPANQCNLAELCCAPNCAGRQCGPDGCGRGGTCGSCPRCQTCSGGSCTNVANGTSCNFTNDDGRPAIGQCTNGACTCKPNGAFCDCADAPTVAGCCSFGCQAAPGHDTCDGGGVCF
jgi:hypothetical protein